MNPPTKIRGASEFAILWPSFPQSALLHDTSGPLEDPLLPYLADAWHMNHKAGDCQWDRQTKEVLFEGVGPCTFNVKVTKLNIPIPPANGQDFTVTVVGLFASLSWNDFYVKTLNSRAGESTEKLEPPVTVPAADSTQIVHKSGPCTWDEGAKKINFQATGNCIITVTAKKKYHKNFSKDFVIDPALGTIQIDDPGAHGIVLTNGVEVPALVLTGLIPEDVTKTYTSNTPHICTVDPDTGAVTGKRAGTCGIEVTLSKPGFNDRSYSYTVQVTGLFSTILWEDFPRAAEEGVPTEPLNPPVSSPPADSYTIVYKSGDCTWDNTASVISFTGIAECILTVTMEKAGYDPLSKDFSVTAVGVFDSLNWACLPLYRSRRYTHNGYGRSRFRPCCG